MPDANTKLETLIFDYGTTYRTSYCAGELKAEVPTVYKAKDQYRMVRPPPLSDVHTLSQWKGVPVPFGLLHKRKPVVNEDPRRVPEQCEKSVDADRAKAQMSRPRVYMTPAVAMDDIADPTAREILIRDMYTSTMTRATREAVSEYSRVAAPFPGLPAPANPIVLPKQQPPVVPAEWRMESVAWDSRQLRAHCDATKEFWMDHKLP